MKYKLLTSITFAFLFSFHAHGMQQLFRNFSFFKKTPEKVIRGLVKKINRETTNLCVGFYGNNIPYVEPLTLEEAKERWQNFQKQFLQEAGKNVEVFENECPLKLVQITKEELSKRKLSEYKPYLLPLIKQTWEKKDYEV